MGSLSDVLDIKLLPVILRSITRSGGGSSPVRKLRKWELLLRNKGTKHGNLVVVGKQVEVVIIVICGRALLAVESSVMLGLGLGGGVVIVKIGMMILRQGEMVVRRRKNRSPRRRMKLMLLLESSGG
nr:hypothetical protein Itr_chr06CG09790 [Ipomoea trifida]